MELSRGQTWAVILGVFIVVFTLFGSIGYGITHNVRPTQSRDTSYSQYESGYTNGYLDGVNQVSQQYAFTLNELEQKLIEESK